MSSQPSPSQPPLSLEEQAAEARVSYASQMATLEAEERAKFEQELITEKARAYREYESQIRQALPPEVLVTEEPYDFEADWAAEETKARKKFEADLVAHQTAFKRQIKQRQAYIEKTFIANVEQVKRAFEMDLAKKSAMFMATVESQKQKYKREYAMQTGKQWLPREMQAWQKQLNVTLAQQMKEEGKRLSEYMATESQRYKGLLSEQQVLLGEEQEQWKGTEWAKFEKGTAKQKAEASLKISTARLKAYEEALALGETKAAKALQSWQTQQYASVEQSLADWEAIERVDFEAKIKEWKSGEWRTFESSLQKEIARIEEEMKPPDRPPAASTLIRELGKDSIPLQFGRPFEASGLELLAAFLEPFEAITYPLAQLAMPEGMYAPATPATLTGGLITSAFMGKVSPELEAFAEKPIHEQVASVGGEVVLTLATLGGGQIVGLAPSKLITAAAINVGLSEAFSLALTGKPLAPEMIKPMAALGVGLAITGTAFTLGAAKIFPVITQATKVGSLARATTQSIWGAGVSGVMGRGDPMQMIQGAAWGAGFSLASEYIITPAMKKLPQIKFGDVKIPLETGGEARWRGLYFERGAKASKIWGKWSGIGESLDDIILSHGFTGEEAGWIPKTSIEARMTRELMQITKYDPLVMQDVDDVLYLMAQAKGVKSQFIKEWLPEETQTLSQKGVSTLKDFLLENLDDIEKLYGSYTQRSQVSEAYEYVLDTGDDVISALRKPADIDIQLGVKVTPERASSFAQDLLKSLKNVGLDVSIRADKPTLILARTPSGAWRHAVDIHLYGDPIQAVPSKAWGFDIIEKTFKIEGLPSQRLSEQALAKGVSVLGFTLEKTISPVSHRMKDVPDLLQSSRTLLDSKKLFHFFTKAPSAKDISTVTRLAGRFGVTDIMATSSPMTRDFIVSMTKTQVTGAAIMPSLAALHLTAQAKSILPKSLRIPSARPSLSKIISSPSKYIFDVGISPISSAYKPSKVSRVKSFLSLKPSTPSKVSRPSKPSIPSGSVSSHIFSSSPFFTSYKPSKVSAPPSISYGFPSPSITPSPSPLSISVSISKIPSTLFKPSRVSKLIGLKKKKLKKSLLESLLWGEKGYLYPIRTTREVAKRLGKIDLGMKEVNSIGKKRRKKASKRKKRRTR